ncbi:MAG TPA: hypothetical protein VF960_07770, partial [Chloroflexota bacterium]
MTEKIAGGVSRDGRAELISLWETARKILAQELKTGCLDRTVLGGLERYLERWSESVYDLDGAYPTRPEAAQVLRLLADYAGLTSADRTVGVRGSIGVVDEVLARLAELPFSTSTPTGARSQAKPLQAPLAPRDSGTSSGRPAPSPASPAAGTARTRREAPVAPIPPPSPKVRRP